MRRTTEKKSTFSKMSQNIFKRVGELHKRAQTGELRDDELTEYNKIDDSITSAMMSGEPGSGEMSLMT